MAEEYQQQQQSNICSNWWSNNGSSTNNQSGRSSNGYDQSGSGSAGDHSVSVSGSSSSMMFLNTNQKLPGTAPGLSLSGGDGGGCGVLVDPNMQVIGLGLSQRADWDQTLLRGGKADQSSFRSMLEEDHISSSSNFQQEIQWKPGKIFTGHGEESSLNRSGFSLDQQQQQFSSPVEEHSTITCHNLSTGYMENPQSIVYGGGGSPSSMLQSLLGSNSNQPQQQQQNFFDQRAMDDYSYGTANYIGMNSNESQFMPPSDFSSNNKFAQFPSNSPPKPQQQTSQNQLQFSNNAPYWNARVGPSSFMSSLQPHQFPAAAATRTNSSFEEKPNNKNNVVKELVNKDSSVVKKSGSEASSKRPRNESSPSTALPPFKVKKEKMGDRITALQQLVSPFGKTDTASVLSESIEYIKILHEQVLVLTTPYLKNGAMMQQLHHQHLEKSSSKDYSKQQGPKQDLRSRGLCLVPLSSTFPVTHETSVDFWTPTFGGPLR